MVPPFNILHRWDFIKLIIVVIAHAAMYIMNALAPIFLIIYTPWYIACPLITVIASPLVSGVYCAFNQLENNLRHKLGLEILKEDFSLHYTKLILNKLKR